MNRLLQLLFVCHRLPERSFFYHGRQFPICARCTGILLGYILGIIYGVFFKPLSIGLAILLIVPLVLDGYLQYISWRQSTNFRRLSTGILAGIGADFILYNIVLIGFRHGQQITRWFFLHY